MQVHTSKAICSGCGKASVRNVLGLDGPFAIPERPWVVITVRNELYPGGRGFFICSDECRAAVLERVDKEVAATFRELNIITLALRLGMEKAEELLAGASASQEETQGK